MEAGRYDAVTTAATVYEKDGKLLLAVAFNVAGVELKAYWVLIQQDGTANTKVILKIREWTGWDGLDPYWLVEHAGKQIACEVTVTLEPGFKTPGKLFPKIKWVDRAGGEGSMPPLADRASIMAKFGSKFRSVAGPQAVGAVSRPVQPAPKQPVAPLRAPLPCRAAHTQTSCWEALQAKCPDLSTEALTQRWFAFIGDKEQDAMTAEDWAQMAKAIAEYSGDDEPMPF